MIICRHYHFGILKHVYSVGMISSWVIFPLNTIPLFFKLPRFLVEYRVPGTACTVVTADLKSTSSGGREINDLTGAFGRRHRENVTQSLQGSLSK